MQGHFAAGAGRWWLIDGDAHSVFRDQLRSTDFCTMRTSALLMPELNQKDKADKRINSCLHSWKPNKAAAQRDRPQESHASAADAQPETPLSNGRRRVCLL